MTQDIEDPVLESKKKEIRRLVDIEVAARDAHKAASIALQTLVDEYIREICPVKVGDILTNVGHHKSGGGLLGCSWIVDRVHGHVLGDEKTGYSLTWVLSGRILSAKSKPGNPIPTKNEVECWQQTYELSLLPPFTGKIKFDDD